MDIIIFGTGSYYNLYKKELVEFNIKYIVDNNLEKQGKLIDGKKVCSPDEVDFSECDYVVVLIKAYYEIEKQLIKYNVLREKMVYYFELKRLKEAKFLIRSSDKNLSIKEWVDDNKNKKIMLVSHELSRTGVPIALMNLAILLKKMGYAVLYTSLRRGSLSEELVEHNIDYIDNLNIVVNNPEFVRYAKEFDLFILGTLALIDYLPLFIRYDVPIMWWIHESNESFFMQDLPSVRLENVHWFGGGKFVVKTVKKCFGVNNMQELLYFLPNSEEMLQKRSNDRIKFAVVGTFCPRKAQDILADAISLIPTQYKNKYEVIFVGEARNNSDQEYYKNLKEKYPDLCCLGEMSQKQLDEFYKEIDVYVCPSRNDTMPIVVTQAMQRGIPCVVSDEVGQAEYIKHGENGFVFTSEDVEALTNIMVSILENKTCLQKIGANSRLIFKEHFSETKMRTRMVQILDELLKQG